MATWARQGTLNQWRLTEGATWKGWYELVPWTSRTLVNARMRPPLTQDFQVMTLAIPTGYTLTTWRDELLARMPGFVTPYTWTRQGALNQWRLATGTTWKGWYELTTWADRAAVNARQQPPTQQDFVTMTLAMPSGQTLAAWAAALVARLAVHQVPV